MGSGPSLSFCPFRESGGTPIPFSRRMAGVSTSFPIGPCARFPPARPRHNVSNGCQDRHNFDIYVSKLVGGHWRDPERLPEPVSGPGTEFFASEAANGNL